MKKITAILAIALTAISFAAPMASAATPNALSISTPARSSWG